MHMPVPGGTSTRVSTGARRGAVARRCGPAQGAIAAGDHDTARDAVRVLYQTALSPHVAASARKSLEDIDDALGPTAYWRAPTWKRVAATAGPAANIVLALVLFTFLFMTSAGKATTVEQVTDRRPPRRYLRAGDCIVSIEGQRVEPGDVARLIQGPTGHR